ncbi:cupin domain-containing protein [Patescibacteria group bacterium]|nr:cupin domain-containing protein [Patescibacteria group bacterium]
MKVNSKACIVWEYNLPSQKVGVASALINGRYPKEGWVVNKKIEEVYYIESGKGRVMFEDEECVVKKGDMVYLAKGKKYWVRGDKLRLVVVTAPPWYKEQYSMWK